MRACAREGIPGGCAHEPLAVNLVRNLEDIRHKGLVKGGGEQRRAIHIRSQKLVGVFTHALLLLQYRGDTAFTPSVMVTACPAARTTLFAELRNAGYDAV